MILGIDASNIRAGGGITHLQNLLCYAEPKNYNFDKIIVWGSTKTLAKLGNKEWLVKIPHPFLDSILIFRVLWKLFILGSQLKKNNISILFSPDGTYSGNFKPYVSMSQNMLIFEKRESKRFGWRLPRLRYFILRLQQKKSLNKSSANIFLSEYACNVISNANVRSRERAIINHGISKVFSSTPKQQKDITGYSFNNPIKVLYVSIINYYKHQWNIVKAVASLRKTGLPVELILVGPAYKPALKKLKKTIAVHDPYNEFIKYKGEIPHEHVNKFYRDSDIFIFASSCENMPNILLEAMSAGMPILSSCYGPMPEFLKEAGLYFDPTNVEDIADKLKLFINNSGMRQELAAKAFNQSLNFTWEKCSSNTIEYLQKAARYSFN